MRNINSIEHTEALISRYQRIDCHRAEKIFLEHFGIAGEAARIDTEKDDTFIIATPSGQQTRNSHKYVLKIDNPFDSFELSMFILNGVNHVSLKNPSIPIPQTLRTIDGNPYSIVESDEGIRCCHAMAFLDGNPVDRLPPLRSETLNQIGELEADLLEALSSFHSSGEKRPDLLWEMKALPRLKPAAEALIEESTLRKALLKQIDYFEDCIGPVLQHCERQICHNDFNSSNVLLVKDQVSGILDFGDMVLTEVISDLAVSLSYFELFPPAGGEGTEIALLSGYFSRKTLPDDELRLLSALIRTRIAITILVPEYISYFQPERARYLKRYKQEAVSRFLEVSDSESNFDDFIQSIVSQSMQLATRHSAQQEQQ